MLNQLAQTSTAEHVHLPSSSDADLYAAVVLSGGTILDQRGYPALSATGDRLRVAAAGYHLGRYPRILLTGSPIKGLSRDRDPQRSAQLILADMGVPSAAVLPINAATRTTAEAMSTIAAWLERHPNAQLALISSDWHLPRAMQLAARAGIADRLHPLSADPTEVPPINPENFIPHGQGFMRVQTATWEWVGLWINQ